MRRFVLLVFLLASGCLGNGANDNRPAYLMIRLTVPETFPLEQPAAGEIALAAVPGQPAIDFLNQQGLFSLGGLTVHTSTREDADHRPELLVSFGQNPLQGRRNVDLYLYAQRAGADGGAVQSPPMQVRARLFKADGQLLADGQS